MSCVPALLLLSTLLASTGSERPIRQPAQHSLSPDGRLVAFSWKGDVWVASVDGGKARRLTSHPAPDGSPEFSPDGSEIAFLSRRSGSTQVWVLPASGGTPLQLTFHSSGCSLEEWTPDGEALLIRRDGDTSWHRAGRFWKISRKERKAPEMLFDAFGYSGRFSPDGSKLAFCRGGTVWWRRGYRGSQACQIWMYDFQKSAFEKVLSHEGGSRAPSWQSDGKKLCYAGAEEKGIFSLRELDLDTGRTRSLLPPGVDPVNFPVVSRDGSTIVFKRLFDLYRFRPGEDEAPVRIKLTPEGESIPPSKLRFVEKTAQEIAFSEDGLEIALVLKGDLYVMDTVLKEPRPVVQSAGWVADVIFSKKRKALYFTIEKEGRLDIWKAERKDPDLPWWRNEEFPLTRVTDDALSERNLSFSPDGSRLAYVRGKGTLACREMKTGKTTEVVRSWNAPYYNWSPDGQWVVYSVQDADYNRDVWVVPVDGSRPPFNLSCHPDYESNPVWSPDGATIAFVGRRRDTEIDIYYVSLRREKHEETSRDRRFREAVKKTEGKKKEKAKEEKKAKDVKKKEEKKEKEAKEKKKDDGVKIDFEGIHDRIRRISISDARERGLFWSPDSKKLGFQGSIKGKPGTYYVQFPDKLTPTLLSDKTGSVHRWLSSGNRILWFSGGVPGSLTATGARKEYRFSVPLEKDPVAYQRAAFLRAWRVIGEEYYDEGLNGLDWEAVRKKYEEAAAQAPSAGRFEDVLEQMFGELNGSHLGFQTASWRKWKHSDAWTDQTAHPGVLWDADYPGPGLKVKRVIEGAPASFEKSRLSPGDVVLSIDGVEVTPETDLTRVLNGPANRDLFLKVQDDKGEDREIRMRPLSWSSVPGLLYREWIKENRARVEKASKETLGYLHIRSMGWGNFQKFDEELYSAGSGRDGLIIDLRQNGGGFIADHLLTALAQPRHAVTVQRGGQPGYPQDRMVYATWHKPIVVICNQNCFSNAEIFCHAIRALKRGRLVGVRTAGGVISTGRVDVLGMGRMGLPGRGWYLLENGEDMELNGAAPHVTVHVAPGDLPAGRDPQLDRAVEMLLEDVEKWRSRSQPALKKARER